MNFVDVTEHSLQDAEPGINLVEQIIDKDDFKFFLFGTTSKADVLLAAQEAIDDDADGASPAKVSEIAIAIPFSSDSIYYLTGSGYVLNDAEFAYQTPGGEGTRSLSFLRTSRSPKVTAKDFGKMALSDSSLWVDDFLFQYGTPVVDAGDVTRSAPATHHHAKKKAKRLSSIDEFLAN